MASENNIRRRPIPERISSFICSTCGNNISSTEQLRADAAMLESQVDALQKRMTQLMQEKHEETHKRHIAEQSLHHEFKCHGETEGHLRDVRRMFDDLVATFNNITLPKNEGNSEACVVGVGDYWVMVDSLESKVKSLEEENRRLKRGVGSDMEGSISLQNHQPQDAVDLASRPGGMSGSRPTLLPPIALKKRPRTAN